ncbi:MAG: hypothetical protein SWH68_02525, partial [Thermodesulfobacteriota bacterium]|nr:hypothetical protein [Thermodesulfobacteriota bacterium]
AGRPFFCILFFDGFVKSPISVLRCIPRHCGVRQVRLIPRDLRALILNFLLCRPKSDFLRDYLLWASKEKYERKMGRLTQIAVKNQTSHKLLTAKTPRRG